MKDALPSALPGMTAFRPRFPWLSGDLQTLRNFVRRPYHDLGPWPATRLELPLRDGSGDRQIEEHTSELQSLMRISYAVFCLKKKQHTINKDTSVKQMTN